MLLRDSTSGCFIKRSAFFSTRWSLPRLLLAQAICRCLELLELLSIRPIDSGLAVPSFGGGGDAIGNQKAVHQGGVLVLAPDPQAQALLNGLGELAALLGQFHHLGGGAAPAPAFKTKLLNEAP